MVIYKITNLINGKVYVGQTKRSIKSRFREHAKKDFPIGKAIRKYGKENFKIEILERCETQEQLNEREQFWIAKLNCLLPNGYNCTTGGNVSCSLSEELIAMRSESATKMWASISEEERSNMAKRREAAKTFEERSETAKRAAATRRIKAAMKTPEERAATQKNRSSSAKKRAATRTAAERSMIAKKAAATRKAQEESKTPAEKAELSKFRSEVAKKIKATMTPARRSEIARKSRAGMSPEELSSIAKKAWVTRRANKVRKMQLLNDIVSILKQLL